MLHEWLPNANEIYTKKKKCTWPTPEFCVGSQGHLYSTDWRRGLASGLIKFKFGVGGLASGNAKKLHQLMQNIPTCWYILHWVTQNSGVGCIAQRQPPTPGILRSGGI